MGPGPSSGNPPHPTASPGAPGRHAGGRKRGAHGGRTQSTAERLSSKGATSSFRPMEVFELVIALLLVGAALAAGPAHRPALSRAPRAGRRRTRADAGDAVGHARSRAGARALRGAGAARRGVRRLPRDLREQLASGGEPGAGHGRAHGGGRGGRRPVARARPALGRRHRARRHRGAARRGRRHRGAQTAPAAAPAARDPRGREPLQRRERAPDLPARGRARPPAAW